MTQLFTDAPASNDTTIPEKFLDKETNTIRVDALLKSYLELEKKQARDKQQPQQDEQPNLLNKPESANGYAITISHDMFTQDDEINQRLFEHGFTNAQAQMLYDLAAEKMVPLVLEIAGEFEAERQLDRLVTAFGGKERYYEIARQLRAYGEKHLTAEVLDSLSTSYDGVMALYRMMQSSKPLATQQHDMMNAEPALDESALRSMMRDPKYWRDKDAAFIKKVSDGFRQVFSEHTN